MVAIDISHERRLQRRAPATGPGPSGSLPERPLSKLGKSPKAISGAVVPQSVKGKFRTIKWMFLAVALAIYWLLPFVRWARPEGEPNQAVLIDLEKGRLHLFGLEIWPQELYLLTALLVLATLVLILMNALAGRIWCGFMCPQTVWTDLFIAVERAIEGDRRQRLNNRKSRLGTKRLGQIVLKHSIWIGISLWTGTGLVLYFGDAFEQIQQVFHGHSTILIYSWILIISGITYSLAGFAREVVCTSMCPWPRLQGAIWDPEALTVNYRDYRGEPRGSVKKVAELRAAGESAGDCVDCLQCVVVCPIGIDIRHGPSFACINCGLCVDACDGVMNKLGRSRGLIDYETWNNIERGRLKSGLQRFKPFRPVTIGVALGIVTLAGGVAALTGTRDMGGLFVDHERSPLATRLSDGRIRNAYTLRIINKDARPQRFVVAAEAGGAALEVAVIGQHPVVVEKNATAEVRVTLSAPHGFEGEVKFKIKKTDANAEMYSAIDRFFTLR